MHRLLSVLLLTTLVVACGGQQQQPVDLQATIRAAVAATQAAQSEARAPETERRPTAPPTPARQTVSTPIPTEPPLPPPTERPVSPNAPQGFLAVSPDSVQFLQWTETGAGQITGRFQTVQLSDEEAFLVEPQSGQLGGTVTEGNVSLSFGGTDAYQGTLDGDTLTLVVPDPSGELATIEYRRAGVADYNRAARAFRASVDEQAISAYATEAAIQATTEAYAAEATRVAGNQAAWEAALDEADAAIQQIVVTDPESWFTAADDGDLGFAIQSMRDSVRYLRADVAARDCDSFRADLDTLQQELDDLAALREDLAVSASDVRQAVRNLQDAREAIGREASNRVIRETQDVVSEADRSLKLLDEKTRRAQQIAGDFEREANGLRCGQ